MLFPTDEELEGMTREQRLEMAKERAERFENLMKTALAYLPSAEGEELAELVDNLTHAAARAIKESEAKGAILKILQIAVETVSKDGKRFEALATRGVVSVQFYQAEPLVLAPGQTLAQAVDALTSAPKQPAH